MINFSFCDSYMSSRMFVTEVHILLDWTFLMLGDSSHGYSLGSAKYRHQQ